MGNARYSEADWRDHVRATRGRTRSQIFTQNRLHPDLDPSRIRYREAVDSDANPHATPIILAADETGSMGILAETIIKSELGRIMSALYDKKPIPDPQILCAAIGDAYVDQAPIQVTQFEANSVPLVEQIAKMYLEAGGGGNGGESYPLVWAFARYKTKCDAIQKRHRKGYIFTIGDESPHSQITGLQMERFLGIASPDLDTSVLLREVQRNWHVFHLIVKPVIDQPVVSTWRKLLGEHAIVVDNIEHLAPGIVTTIQLTEGANPSDLHDWDDSDRAIVRSVVGQLVKA